MSNITPGMSETQNAVSFINTEVLSQDVNPKVGSSATMIDQSVGMMVQDLQVFLKGFEQIGLVALTKLVNNILTYGTYYNPANDKSGAKNDTRYLSLDEDNSKTTTPEKTINPNDADGKEIIHSLFKMVTEYGEAKSKISALMHNPNISKSMDDIYTKKPFKPVTPNPPPVPNPTITKSTNVTPHKDIEDHTETPVTSTDEDKPKQTPTKEKTYWFSKKK